MPWSDSDFATLAATDDFHVAPHCADGIPGTPTWIWCVGVDGGIYIRGYHGQLSSWYQSAIAFGEGIITAGGHEIAVTFTEVSSDDPILDRVDAAYRVRCAPSPYVAPMVSQRARTATVRVEPCATYDRSTAFR